MLWAGQGVATQTRIFAGRHRQWILWGAGLAAVSACYFVIFALTRDQPLEFHVCAVARNVISLALSVWIVRAVLVRWSLRLDGLLFWAVQIALALAFTALWAWLLNLTEGLIGSGSAIRFTVSPVLAGTAVTWQLLQGLFVYVAVAALTMLEQRAHGAIVLMQDPEHDRPDRFLLRAGEDLTTIAAQDIVSITGAGDYSELVTAAGNHLVPTSLIEFEALLDTARFVRVHRSAIANLRHVRRAEPIGGGRMILRMDAGPDLPVSRAGARLLREQAL